MVFPTHWGSVWFIFKVGFAMVGTGRIGDNSYVVWVPENVHLNKSEDGEIKRSDSDGEKR